MAAPPSPPERLRFPPTARMRSKRDFQLAYSKGARARGPVFTVVAVENGLGRTRLGLSVGKRIWKHAVKRNRVRRVFREAFRIERAQLPAGFDLVLIPARPRLQPRLQDCREELVRLAHQAVEKRLRRRERDAEQDVERERPS